MDLEQAKSYRLQMHESRHASLRAERIILSDPGQPEYFRSLSLPERFNHLFDMVSRLGDLSPQVIVSELNKEFKLPDVVVSRTEGDLLLGAIRLGFEYGYGRYGHPEFIQAAWQADLFQEEGMKVLNDESTVAQQNLDFRPLLVDRDMVARERIEIGWCYPSQDSDDSDGGPARALNQLALSLEIYRPLLESEESKFVSKRRQLDKIGKAVVKTLS